MSKVKITPHYVVALVVLVIVAGLAGYFVGSTTAKPIEITVTKTVTQPITTTVFITTTVIQTFTPPATQTPTPTPTITPPLEYQEIDTLVISQRADLSTIDVHHATDAPTLTVFSHVYETLFKLEFDENLKPRFVPHLVESYRQINDTVYEFKLRRGAKFHDGTSLTAYDVKASFERAPKVGGLPRILLGPVESVEVIDEQTFILKLKYPFTPIVAHLAHPSTSIIPRRVAELFPDKPINETKYIIGTGPFKFVEFSKGVRTVLERFNDYWGAKPTVKKIVWRPIADDDSRVAALEAGDVDVITHVPPHLAKVLRDKNFKVIQIPSTRVIYIGINVDTIPDKRVRQALNYAVDKDSIVREILEGAGRVADAPIPPVVFGYTKQAVYEYSVEKARKLLEEAGWIGREVVFIAPHGRYLKDREIAEAVQAMLMAVGLRVKLEIEPDWAKYIQRVTQQRDFDLFLLGWSTVTLDADYGLYSLFRSGAAFNRMNYSNSEVDKLLDQARMESNPEKRLKLYAEAIAMIWEDAPWIFLHVEDIIVAMKPNIIDVEIQPIERWLVGYAKILKS